MKTLSSFFKMPQIKTNEKDLLAQVSADLEASPFYRPVTVEDLEGVPFRISLRPSVNTNPRTKARGTLIVDGTWGLRLDDAFELYAHRFLCQRRADRLVWGSAMAGLADPNALVSDRKLDAEAVRRLVYANDNLGSEYQEKFIKVEAALKELGVKPTQDQLRALVCTMPKPKAKSSSTKVKRPQPSAETIAAYEKAEALLLRTLRSFMVRTINSARRDELRGYVTDVVPLYKQGFRLICGPTLSVKGSSNG